MGAPVRTEDRTAPRSRGAAGTGDLASGRPLVTIVTVCFNAGRHLAEAIESVLGQTYGGIEYLLIDGGSTDDTLGIIRSYEGRFGGRLSWTSEADAGIYDAMNKGIARSNGELIGLLNADDSYFPEAVQRAVEAYLEHPDAGAVYGDAEIIDRSGALMRVERARVLAPGEVRPDRMPMCHQSLFVTRGAYEEIGTYDTTYRVLADYEWMLRALSRGIVMVHVPAPLARFRAGGVCSAEARRSTLEREQIRVAYGANRIRERARRLWHEVIRGCSPVTRGVRGLLKRVRGVPAPAVIRLPPDGE